MISRRYNMKKAALFTVIFILMAGIAHAKEFEVMDKVDGYHLEFKVDDLRVGANDIEIKIRDESDNYITDAKVTVMYSMPEGVDLYPMFYKSVMELKGKEYKGTIKIPMSGSWDTRVIIRRAGEKISMSFDMDVVRQ